MLVKEINAKTILSKSKVSDYTINPYIGCEHSCTYCYAKFMKRFTGHKEKWGKFVDVKINADILLQNEIKKKGIGTVWISGVCDPYQPLEEEYEITKKCLETLIQHDWPIMIQTKSPLVIRDLEELMKSEKVEVGFTVTTADDDVRKIFEPKAPSIQERIETLDKLHSVGIKTFAMIAPLLPRAEKLTDYLQKKVDRVLIDRMNYHYADQIYKMHNFEYAMTDNYFSRKGLELSETFKKEGIPSQVLF